MMTAPCPMSMSTSMFRSSLNTLRQIEFYVFSVKTELLFTNTPLPPPLAFSRSANVTSIYIVRYSPTGLPKGEPFLLPIRKNEIKIYVDKSWRRGLRSGVTSTKLVFYANCIIKHKNIVFSYSTLVHLFHFVFFLSSFSLVRLNICDVL